MKLNTINYLTKSLLIGYSLGDAMGVPFEFIESYNLVDESFDEMVGYGSHNQPAGSFSDDSSLTFCLVESLENELTLEETAKLFLKWKDDGYWTANGNVFDIGITTSIALENFRNGGTINEMAPADERSCGNGSMMRLLPLAFYFDGKSFDQKYELIKKYGSLTHRHIRTYMATLLVVELAYQIIQFKKGKQKRVDSKIVKRDLVIDVIQKVINYFKSKSIFNSEIETFENALNSISFVKIQLINNSGYVIDTLICVFQAFVICRSYENDIKFTLKMGGDTDTNAAIIGGLSGLFYGFEHFPQKWVQVLSRREDIINLANKWALSIVENRNI
jgi:ADP-ribosyl-[dinitrogen reductase] hydrolase